MIIINCSNLHKGGALQVAASFIDNLLKLNSKDEFFILVSQTLFDEVNFILDISSDNRFIIFENSPAHNKNERKRILDFVIESKCSVFFTLFGPDYLVFKNNKSYKKPYLICGFADGWATHSVLKDYRNVYKSNYFSLVKHWLVSQLKLLFLKNKDLLIFETNQAKVGYGSKLINKIFNNHQRLLVIPNTVRDSFRRLDVLDSSAEAFTIGILTADYAHKNIFILLEVCRFLVSAAEWFDFRFKISISEDSATAIKFQSSDDWEEYSKYFDFIGNIPVKEAPIFISSCNVILQISLLETFSATYLEAQASKKCLVAADKPFAHEICGEGALFVDPLDSQAIGNALIELKTNKNLCEVLISKGVNNLERFPTEYERFLMYWELITNGNN